MRTPEQAWEHIEDHLAPLSSEETRRGAALGRVLAAAISGTVDMPPADVSAMDGYALAGDVTEGARLPVVATAAAGSPLDLTLAAGTAAKIMTGAVVPSGADRVIPVEQTDGGTQWVTLRAIPAAGAHIRRGGEVSKSGDPLLAPGTVLGPGALSLLASHGYGTVLTHRRPHVCVLTTGDELVPPEEQPGPGQLRDSNTAFLLAALRTLGIEGVSLGTAPDRKDALREYVARGLEGDVLLLCGGVSMGDYDFVEEILVDLGCELLFDKVAIQPGKPLVAGRHAGGWVFGLPGNPASVMVTFWLFVRPVLRRLLGMRDHFWHGALGAELLAPLPANKGRDRFLHAAVTTVEGRLLALPQLPRGSHDVVAYGPGNALVRMHPHAPAVLAGAACEILPLYHWPS